MEGAGATRLLGKVIEGSFLMAGGFFMLAAWVLGSSN